MLSKNIDNFSFKLFFKNNFGWILSIALLVLLIYANSINNNFVSDDLSGIVNMNISSFDYVKDVPSLNRLDYFLKFKIAGFNPAFFRIFNILLHLGSSIIIFILFSILINKKTAILTASLFAVHPILTEPIVWISGAGYLWYSFLFLLSFLFFILSSKNKKYYFLSIFFFLTCINFSEKAFILFFVFIVYSFLFCNLRREYKRLIPFVVLGLGYAFLSFQYLGNRVEFLSASFEKPQFYNPLFQIPVAITSYFQLFFWPDKLTLYHSEMSFSLINFIARVIIFLSIVAYWILSFWKSKQIFFWFCFFAIVMIPYLTPFGISWIVAERYIYLGSVAVFAMFSIFISKLLAVKKYTQIVYTIFIIIIIILSIRTVIRNNDWKNEDNLWIATARTSPSSPNTHNNLGDVYQRHGDLKNAEKEFKKAIEIKPNYSEAYHNLANTYMAMGKLDKATENYNKALQLNPYLWQSYQELAGVYFMQSKYPEAILNIEKAIKINPVNLDLKLSLAIVYSKTGEVEKAKKIINELLFKDATNQKAKELLKTIEEGNLSSRP